MDQHRYFWFQAARALIGASLIARPGERWILDDAAEGFLLARSHDEHLEDTIDSASWALTELTLTGVLAESDARDLWDAMCASGPPGLRPTGFATCEPAPADEQVAAARLRWIVHGRGD